MFTDRRTEERENVWMSKVFPGYSLFAEPLCHRSLGLIITRQQNVGRVSAHAKWFIELLRNVKPNDFDGNFPTLEFTLKYLGWMRVLCRLQGLVTIVLEFHRVRNHPVAAAKFAQLIEFCGYFVITYQAFLELLQDGC